MKALLSELNYVNKLTSKAHLLCNMYLRESTYFFTLKMYFLLRGYPMNVREEAATLAGSKDRSSLLPQTKLQQDSDIEDKVFLITTFHPTYNALRKCC